MYNNSNFISNSFNNSMIDLMSCTSDSYPIGPVTGSLNLNNLIYGSFMCVGDLLIQFSSNQSNSILLTIDGSCNYPIPMSGTNLPNAFLLTGNNKNPSGSMVTANNISSSCFGYSILSSDGTGAYLNFLCISPRPTYFKPKVPFITTGSPYIYWSNSSTLTLTYTDTVNQGTITFTDTSSMDISINLMSGGGGGGSGGTGGINSGTNVGGQGGTGGSACYSTMSISDLSLNTQYYCVVGKGGTGGISVPYNSSNSNSNSNGNTISKGNDGQNGSGSWVGPSVDSSSNCLALATGNNTGGSGGGNSVQESTASDNAVNGLGGYGGNSNNGNINGYTNNGQVGADYSQRGGTWSAAVMGGTNIAYAAGGGGGKYHNGTKGDGGTGSSNGNYGGGGDGGGNSGSDGVSPSIIIGSFFPARGGGGGGGGGGNCDSNGQGSTSGAGGNGADGYIQIVLTFKT